MAPSRPRVALLGATGSIGTQTLDVLREQREHFDLVAVSGGQRLAELAVIAKEFSVHSVGVVSERDRDELRALLGPGVQVVVGAEGLAELAARADVVVNAVVGFAGLPVTLSALSAGKRLALANKESLIAAAPLVEKVRRPPGAVILPIDSEHCAIHQCLAGSLEPGHPDVRLLHLTASGGPFRGMTKEQLGRVSKHDALQHPTWTMGPKITVDSSTLMNKGLEVLEASALFGIEVERVNVVVHPQSIVHSMVEYVDGAVLAQLSLPDMRLPIAYCLGEPVRFSHAWGQMDFAHAFSLDFEAPDREAFGALDLAYEASRLGGAAPAWLSAANEIAVEAFLNDQIEWSRIVPLVADVLSQYEPDPLDTLASLFENDATARRLAHAMVPR